MKQVAIAVLKKEVWEVLRDKRTLFLAILLPLFFYPAMVGISLHVSRENAATMVELKPVVLAVGVPEAFLQSRTVSWKVSEVAVDPASALPEGVTALVVIEDGLCEIKHSNGPSGLRARAALMHIAKDYQRKYAAMKLKDVGLSYSQIEPYAVEVESDFGIPSELSGQLGGAGAYFMIFLAFTGCMSVAVDAGAGERERGTLEAMMATPASLFGMALGKILFVIAMGALSVLSTLIGMASVLWFKEEARDLLSEVLNISAVAQMGVLMLGVVLVFASVLYGVALLAKSSREAHLKASMLMMLVAVLLVVSGAEYVAHSNWVPFVPLMNSAVGLAKIFSGDFSWLETSFNFIYLCFCSATVLACLSLVLKRNPERFYLSN